MRTQALRSYPLFLHPVQRLFDNLSDDVGRGRPLLCHESDPCAAIEHVVGVEGALRTHSENHLRAGDVDSLCDPLRTSWTTRCENGGRLRAEAGDERRVVPALLV